MSGELSLRAVVLIGLASVVAGGVRRADAAGDIAITELAHVVVGGVGSTYIEIANLGDAAVDVTGWRLCSRIDYDSTAGAGSWGTRINTVHGTMQPGDVVVLEITANDVAGVASQVGASNYTTVTWTGFDDSAIEDHYVAADMGLYVSSPFNSAANMRDFIKWNTTATVGRETVATPPNNTYWPAATARIPSPLSTDLTDPAASKSFQLDATETAPGSGVVLHDSPEQYIILDGADHSLGHVIKRGDENLDGVVDLADVSALANNCLDGPDLAVAGTCVLLDFDGDNDVDLADFQAFQRAFEG